MINDYIKEIKGKRFYHFTSCGLPNIYLAMDTKLIGVNVREIGGEHFVSINNLHQLHKTISHKLCFKRNSLSGAELIFLRKELEVSVEDMTTITGVSVEKINELEKSIGYHYSYDTMLRSLAVLDFVFERISTYCKFLSTLSTFGQNDVTLYLMYEESLIVNEGYWCIID